MSTTVEIQRELQANLSLYQEILAVISKESHLLRQAEKPFSSELIEAKKTLLSRLKQSLTVLKHHRTYWQTLSAHERASCPQIGALLRQCQDQIMKIIVLDRENEQALLRRGLMPAQHLPSIQRQRPHFVANLYSRNHPPAG